MRREIGTYLKIGQPVAAAVIDDVARVGALSARRLAPRWWPRGWRTSYRRRVRGTRATGATAATLKSSAHRHGVRRSGVVAHQHWWGGSTVTVSREEREGERPAWGRRKGRERWVVGEWMGARHTGVFIMHMVSGGNDTDSRKGWMHTTMDKQPNTPTVGSTSATRN